MNRTVTALYETRAQADHASDALKAAHLGDHVAIHDKTGGGHRPIVDWLGGLLGGHHDKHIYGEGLKRGSFLLSAKVDDLNEIRVAAILDADGPVNLRKAEESWRGEGWAPGAADTASIDPTAARRDPGLTMIGEAVRTYEMAD